MSLEPEVAYELSRFLRSTDTVRSPATSYPSPELVHRTNSSRRV